MPRNQATNLIVRWNRWPVTSYTSLTTRRGYAYLVAWRTVDRNVFFLSLWWWCNILVIRALCLFLVSFLSRPNQPTAASDSIVFVCLSNCTWPIAIDAGDGLSSFTLHAGCNSPRSQHYSSLRGICLTMLVWPSLIPCWQWQTPVVFRPVQHDHCLLTGWSWIN